MKPFQRSWGSPVELPSVLTMTMTLQNFLLCQFWSHNNRHFKPLWVIILFDLLSMCFLLVSHPPKSMFPKCHHLTIRSAWFIYSMVRWTHDLSWLRKNSLSPCTHSKKTQKHEKKQKQEKHLENQKRTLSWWRPVLNLSTFIWLKGVHPPWAHSFILKICTLLECTSFCRGHAPFPDACMSQPCCMKSHS